MLDRFGDVPKCVSALLDIALLRAAAAQEGICDITQKTQKLILSFTDAVDVPALMAVCAMGFWSRKVLLSAGDKPKLTVHLQPKENGLDCAVRLVEDLRLKRQELSETQASHEDKKG